MPNPLIENPIANAKLAFRWALPVLMALWFGVLVIHFSMHQGNLSAPPVPDDVAYFAEAAEHLQLLYDKGPLRFVQHLVIHPPHSPFALANSVAAFSIFGIRDWATPALNVVWLVVLLCLLRAYLSTLGNAEYFAVAACVLAWPIPGFLVLEARPDIVYGLVLAGFVCVTWMGRTRLSDATWAAMSGLLLGAALLIKPSALPLTLALAGVSWSMLALQRTARDASMRPRFIRSAARCLLVAAAVAGSYYLFAWRDVYRYIYDTTFGSQREIWSLRISSLDHLLFYLTGQGGRALYSWWLPLTVLVAAACAAVLYRQRRLPAHVIGISACILLTYVILTYPGHKSVFFGFTLAAFALYAFVGGVKFLFDRLPRSGGSTVPVRRFPARGALTVVLLIAALATFKWPWVHRTAGATELGDSRDARQRFASLAQVADVLESNTARNYQVFFPAFTPYLNSATIRYELAKRRVRNVVATDAHRISDMQHLAPLIAAASVVVLPDDGDPEMPEYLPSTALVPSVRKALSSDPDFRLTKVVPVAGGRSISLFERKHAFDGVGFARGFLGAEGPYPQWNLPEVRWAIGPHSELRINASIADPRRLVLSVQSHLPDQRVDIRAGARSTSCSIPTPGVPVECAVDLGGLNEDRKVVLDFAKVDAADRMQRAALFRGARVEVH